MGPPPTRERYNAKARGSVAGGSHKKRTRPKNKAILEGDDENDVDVVGVEQAAVEEQRDGRGKMSSKKRKRLDSYIVRRPLHPFFPVWQIDRLKAKCVCRAIEQKVEIGRTTENFDTSLIPRSFILHLWRISKFQYTRSKPLAAQQCHGADGKERRQVGEKRDRAVRGERSDGWGWGE